MRKILAAVLGVVTAACWVAARAADDRAVASRPAPAHAGEPVTIFAVSDTHVGGIDTGGRNPALVKLLNALPGESLPAEMGGAVGKPAAVIAAGDLTNTGTAAEWKQFGELYIGAPGGPNPLPARLLECTGNHDRDANRRVVADAVRKRHGAFFYATDLGGVTAVSMDNMLVGGWQKDLRQVLADIPLERPLVLYLHYPVLTGTHAAGKDKVLLELLAGRRIAAILHGHLHGFGCHQVEGIPVVNLPTIRGERPGVAVLRVSTTRVDIACRGLEKGGWFFHKSLPLPEPVAKERPASAPASRPAHEGRGS